MTSKTRQVKVGQYFMEKGKDNIQGYKPDLVEILSITPEGYLFGRTVYYYTTGSLTDNQQYDVYLTGWPSQEFFLKLYKSISKQKFLRRVISESIDLEKFFKAGV